MGMWREGDLFLRRVFSLKIENTMAPAILRPATTLRRSLNHNPGRPNSPPLCCERYRGKQQGTESLPPRTYTRRFSCDTRKP